VFAFIETRLFTRLADEYLGDDGLRALQTKLLTHSDAGDLVRGSGGVRKLRWAVSGRGKCGGLRVIYLVRSHKGQVWLLTLYSKKLMDTISGAVLRKIKEEIDEED
jgi:hypothetical protein